MTLTKIAKWESRSGKHWVVLEHDGVAAQYTGNDCGGSLGIMSAVEAIDKMQVKVNSGYFLPDNAKSPMKRTIY